MKKAVYALITLVVAGSSMVAVAQHGWTPPGDLVDPGQFLVPNPVFYVVNYGGKCLDFGPPPQVTGSPVFIYGCNSTEAQQVWVEEINDRCVGNPRDQACYEVILHAGDKVIGVQRQYWHYWHHGYEIEVPLDLDLLPLVEDGPPLELQDRQDPPSWTQVFALDGDSIILAADRNRVVKVQGNRGANRTPIVLGRRDLADNEFWTFTATDQSDRRPTTGFVHVGRDVDLASAVDNAGWGTVIEVGGDIDLSRYNRTLQLRDGVTLRGDRHGLLSGPALLTGNRDATMLEIVGKNEDGSARPANDVRITGLMLGGPYMGRDEIREVATGILVHDVSPTASTLGSIDTNPPRSIIDHNDLYGWSNAAISVRGAWAEAYPGDRGGQCKPWPSGRQPYGVRIARNLIHHNQRYGLGYGVEVIQDAYALIEGNVFYLNRHAITGGATALTGYRAQYNIVLSDAPAYHSTLWALEQDFDMHGSDPSGHHTGGIAGGEVEIFKNTFLGRNRRNFDLRGVPCYDGVIPHPQHYRDPSMGSIIFRDQFRGNVSLQDDDDAIRWYLRTEDVLITDHIIYGWPPEPPPEWLEIADNRFSAPNPTDHLRVGDFNGDGRDDLFLATGAAWYYSPGGEAEWRLLNVQSEMVGSLLFGDFDGDGRTDVFTQRGRDWFVSWGGRSPWEKINESDARMSEFAIGDFDGDGKADVFYADGESWYISYGGTEPFTRIGASSFRVRDLGFGDFNGDGKTDILGAVHNDQDHGFLWWMVAYGGPRGIIYGWPDGPLQRALTETIGGLIIADFDGDGIADVATRDGRVSYNGRSYWRGIQTRSAIAVGRFDAIPGADVLVWNSRTLDIFSSGRGPQAHHSPQDMR